MSFYFITSITNFMKRYLLITASLFFVLLGCNNEDKNTTTTTTTTPDTGTTAKPQDVPAEQPEVHGTEVKPGEIKYEKPLNAAWVAHGKEIYDLKCQSCHKLTSDRLVGPGWKGVTTRRQPEWIVNMITNVDMMLETDPEAQKLLEQCLVRMPNQNISRDDARQIIEFMRSNDGEK
jgi:cytochrome c